MLFGGDGSKRPSPCADNLGYTDPHGAARLVFSEADGLSGLIVDRYGEYLAIQATALAMAQRLESIVPMLVELIRPRGIVLRNERGVAQTRGDSSARRLALGPVARRAGVYRRARPALRRRSARGTEDRLLSRPAREPPCGRRLLPRAPRARSVLLQRRIRLVRAEAWRRPRGAGRR